MNNGGRCKCLAGLRLIWRAGHVGDEGHDDELESDQCAGRRSHDYVKVRPSAERCHAVASNWIRSTFIRSAGAVTGVLPMPPPSFCARAAEMALSPGRYLAFTIEQWVEAVFHEPESL